MKTTDMVFIGALLFIFAGMILTGYLVNKQINDANMKCVNIGHQFINEGSGWICR